MSDENEKTGRTNVETVTYNTLDSLLGGVYEAVINAQATISQANMDIWKKQHFNQDGSPKTIRIQLPSGVQDIPTLILVPAANIGIKDVSFEMEMNLDINEEIDRDLGISRPLLWNDVKQIASARGWLKTNDEWGLSPEAFGGRKYNDGFLPPGGYRFCYFSNDDTFKTGRYSVWTPADENGDLDWSGTAASLIFDETADLRKNKAFRRWLDLNDFDPAEWGIKSYINTSITADSSARGAGEMAKITVTFEGNDVPEGIARLNDLWVKTLPSS